MSTNRKSYQKAYVKKNYAKIRKYRTEWQKWDRIKRRDLKFKEIVYKQILPLLRNLK